MASAREVFDRFDEEGKEPMALAVIGRDGSHRVWLAAEFCEEKNYEWAHRQLLRAATTALAMQPGAGHA